ncbi:hypothetical protein NIES4106_61380 (plasmid) [Fischerella sp. NIES-4106]|nr:hypothetical protein NIES4106_61380 [Fischerella sp. NIES-4106]
MIGVLTILNTSGEIVIVGDAIALITLKDYANSKMTINLKDGSSVVASIKDGVTKPEKVEACKAIYHIYESAKNVLKGEDRVVDLLASNVFVFSCNKFSSELESVKQQLNELEYIRVAVQEISENTKAQYFHDKS